MDSRRGFEIGTVVAFEVNFEPFVAFFIVLIEMLNICDEFIGSLKIFYVVLILEAEAKEPVLDI